MTDGARAVAALEAIKDEVGFDELLYDDQIGKVSVVGVGMRSHPGVSATFFEALAGAEVNLQMISTSEIRISVIVGADDVDRAVRPPIRRSDWTPTRPPPSTRAPAAESVRRRAGAATKVATVVLSGGDDQPRRSP